MANVALTTDPLDELRLSTPAGHDRLPAMLFLAALFHGILILGVTFNTELADQFANAISLEVTIVADPDQSIDRPDDAEYLAQASQEGGGNTLDMTRPTAPLQSALPVDNLGQEDGTALDDTKANDHSADEVLATENESPDLVEIDPRDDPQPEASVAIAMESGAEVTLPLPQEERATLLITDEDLQRLVVSADTRESAAAAYLHTWQRRIEAVGAAYLPELGDISGATGSPTLMVTLSETGALLDAEVSKSSGSTVLDLASIDIIQRASPFEPFPEAMSEEYDAVTFERKFLFSEKLITDASPAS